MMTMYIADKQALFSFADIEDYLNGIPQIYNKRNKIHYLKIGCGFDIENSIFEVGGFKTGYVYQWQFSLGDYIIMGRTLIEMQNFFEFLTNYLRKKRAFILCWDANLGYEYQYCKRYWEIIGMSKLFAKEKRQPLKLVIGGAIEMRECLGLFGHSLEQIAKTYCTTQKAKGDLDYSLARHHKTPLTDTELGYCYNDVKILQELGNYVFDNYFGKNINLPLTATGMVRAKIKKRIHNISKVKAQIQADLPSEELYNTFRNYLFRGGICGTNALYMNKVLESVVCADYTSDYPAVMNHYLYPMGKPREIKTEDVFLKNVPYIVLVDFRNVHAKTSHSLFSLHKCLNAFEIMSATKEHTATIDNGRIYKAPSVLVYLNDVDYKAFCKAYYFSAEKSVILRAWEFERYGRLPGYVLDVLNEEYLKKESLKTSNQTDTIDYKDAKSTVNSTFGMMCTALFMDNLHIAQNDIYVDGKLKVRKGDVTEYDENGNVMKKSYQEATESMFLNPFWGFWITSYARYLLIDIITRFPKLIIQYDTDSIYYLSTHPDSMRLEQFLLAYNTRVERRNKLLFDNNPHFLSLGTWDIEKPFKRFKGLGSKRYIYEKQDGELKTVIAGCRKGSVQRQYENDVKCGKFNGDIFEFFTNHMTIEPENSGKLGSNYIEDYNGDLMLYAEVTDYKGVTELCEFSSANVLEPIGFNMGLSPLHIDFYRTLKARYINNPFADDALKQLIDIYEY